MAIIPSCCSSQTMFTILFSAKRGHRTCRFQTLSLSYFYTGGAYYVPNNFLFISNKFCNGGERPEQGGLVPLFTCSSTPHSMGLDLPKNTPLKSPGGSSFLGPKWHSPIGLMPFHRAQNTFEFQGPTPYHFPS